MAGQGVKLFQSGDVLTAAQVNGFLMDQAVTRFATSAARDAAFGGVGQPTLTEGRVCYIDDVNLIQFYDGASWQDSGQFTVGDGTISNAKLAANSVTSDKIAPGTVIAADIAAGTITATELADGAVTSGKILDGTIVNADINASAVIALSKLATGALPTAITVASANIVDGTIVNADINAAASIAYSKLNLGTSIVNADINASAAIDKTKISGTAVTLADTGTITSTMIANDTILDADIKSNAAIVDTKLATISTAGKVSNSATTATDANTASAIVARDASGNFIAGKATLATVDISTVIETASIVASALTGTINIDFSTNPTVYYTSNATNDWTLNVRGTSGVTLNNTLATGQIATITFLATIGATQKRPTVFQVDGSAVTPKWMGGTAPTIGNASSIDAYTLAIIKTGSAAFTMLASQTRFA